MIILAVEIWFAGLMKQKDYTRVGDEMGREEGAVFRVNHY